LQGKLIDEPTILAAAQCAEEESTPISDLRASADYRSNIVAVLVRRALTEAAGELLGKGH
jgi:carbon-monoxide dehydrogenase medium subunit